jgi:hypothetical protein
MSQCIFSNVVTLSGTPAAQIPAAAVAVIYGISDPETVIKNLTEKALLCNRRQLSRLARIYGGTLGSMVHAEPAGPPKCFPVLFTFGQYSFELPSQFADIDPMIEVSHKLSSTYFLKKTEN